MHSFRQPFPAPVAKKAKKIKSKPVEVESIIVEDAKLEAIDLITEPVLEAEAAEEEVHADS